MKLKTLLFALTLSLLLFNCSNSIDYSETFKKETAGSYLYNLDDVIEVYYENNKLFLNWRGGKIEPIALEQNEFFVADMYKKFRFVQHPETKERYLSVIPEEDGDLITYDYIKAPAGYKTPSTLLDEGDYERALAGYLEIKKQDSISIFIKERDFTRKGYTLMSKHEYEKGIEVFKLNAALHPNSANVYDNLAQAYLVSGDSLQSYNNYKKTLEINSENRRAKEFVNAYNVNRNE